VHRRPHQGAWGVGGPGESKAPRAEERREVLGRRKGLHVCTSPGRDTGDMGRARGQLHRTLQPLMTIALAVFSLPGDVICVLVCLLVGL
jgi:hypothetical protein